ncbi:DUF4142 domain-containing protein [Ferruginibacter sp.]
MKAKLTVSLAALLLLAACNSKNKDEKTTPQQNNYSVKEDVRSDGRFVREMTAINTASIQLGKLMQKNASQPETKSIARMVINDHGQAGNDLTNLAKESEVIIPDKIILPEQKQYKILLTKSGDEFDEASLAALTQVQQSAITKIENEMNYGQNILLKKWAGEVLSQFRFHLEMTQQVKDALKNKMAGL